MKKGFYSIIYVLLAIYFTGCQEGAGTLSLNDELGSNYTLAFTDTVKLINSTVLLDSVPTIDYSVLLIGKYRDAKLGLVESKAYLQLVNEVAWSIPTDAEYDKVELIADFSSPQAQFKGYHYGDRNLTQSIEVREITGNFTAYNLTKYWIDSKLFSYFSSSIGNLYNTSSIAVGDPLGPIAVFNPNADSAIHVPLNEAFGLKLMNLGKGVTAGEKITGFAEILKYFKGVEISGGNESNVVALFTNNKSTTNLKRTYIRLYYHEIGAGGVPVNKFYDLSFNNTISKFYNFSQITEDRSGTVLSNLNATNKEIPASETNNQTYVQGGVSLATKITFPSLKNLINIAGFKRVNGARLIIEPIGGTYMYDSLPISLMLFHSNVTNLPLLPVLPDFSSVGYQSSKFLKYDATGKSYQFSITQYVQNLINREIAGIPIDDTALMLTVDANEIGQTVSRAIIGSGERADYRARIEIFYLKEKE